MHQRFSLTVWKPQLIPLFIYGTGVVVFLLLTVGHVFHHMTSFAEETCTHLGKTQSIIIKHNTFIPQQVTVSRCDRVVFINQDSIYHQPALGKHPEHILYAGFEEQLLSFGQTNGFVVHTAGTLPFHDHLHEDVQGTISVSPIR